MKKLLSLACLGLSFCLTAQQPVWKSIITTLGDAKSATLYQPGADNTDACIRLDYSKGPWSRFNWPRIRPSEAITGVSFQARRLGKLPPSLSVRVLTSDGVEWHTVANKSLTEDWQTFSLTAKDFQYYRGGDETAVLSFKDVMQVQFLPGDNRAGDGTILIDTVKFLPDGTVFTHDKNEWKQPPQAVETEYARLQDLHHRLDVEVRRLRANSRQLEQWLNTLTQIKDLWTAGQHDQALAHLKAADRPWIAANTVEAAQAMPTALPPFMTKEAYDARIAELSKQPPQTVIDVTANPTLKQHLLYDCVPQQQPVIRTENGVTFIRQHIVFSGNTTQQTVFLDLPMEHGLLNAQGKVISAKIRCTAKGLNDKLPFMLRLQGFREDKLESFIDIKPNVLPTSDWQTLTFDVTAPYRGTRQDPAKTFQVALRVENVPGQADEFDVDLQTMSLQQQPAYQRISQDWLAQRQAILKQERSALITMRTRLTALEDSLHELPELRSAYLQSFAQPVVSATKPPEIAITLSSIPSPKYPEAFAVRSSIVDGKLRLTVATTSFCPRKPTRLQAWLQANGQTIPAYNNNGDSLTMDVNVPLWTPGVPNKCFLLLQAADAKGIIACDTRTIGLRTAQILQSGTSTLLRHVTNRNRPDWFYAYNGQPSFFRTAVFTSLNNSLADCPAETVDVLADLWVEGNRHYGMPVSKTYWNNMETNGLGQLASISPSYKFLTSYNDVSQLLYDYDFDCQKLMKLCSSASPFVYQVGNEVELDSWGAQINTAFKGTAFQPLDIIAEDARRHQFTNAPVMYVRAGSFSKVEPLPHEDISGINQYTGRYGGHLDEAYRDLAELAAEATFFNRPLAITEWNGPKYSWASYGTGGVTTRGAAYYLEKYWRAICQTPGIVGSAEFTLNWVLAPFEDLTNQSREEAYKNRLKHSQFGGGRTADHVPILNADIVSPDELYRSMQGFHSPLYIMMNTPGNIHLYGNELAPLMTMDCLSKTVGLDANVPQTVSTLPKSHVIWAGAVQGNFVPFGGISGIQPLPANATEPSIQTIVNPASPEHLLTVLMAHDQEALRKGAKRLIQAAESLVDLTVKEANMPRILGLTDKDNFHAFDFFVLDMCDRGYFLTGDATRTTLDKHEFLDAKGDFRTAWKTLQAVLIDVNRKVSEDEMAVIATASRHANIIISKSSLEQNPQLIQGKSVTFADNGTFAQPLTLVNALAPEISPIPLKTLGGAKLEVVKEFAPKFADHKGTKVAALAGNSLTPLAVDAQNRPVIAMTPTTAATDGPVTVVLGYDLGCVATVHWRTTHSGKSHPIYDRDTANGLERAVRAALNAALINYKQPVSANKAAAGRHPDAIRRLVIHCQPASMLVDAAHPVPTLRVAIRDNDGKPVSGLQLNARTRLRIDGKTQAVSPYYRIKETAPGIYDMTFTSSKNVPTYDHMNDVTAVPYYQPQLKANISKVLSVQFKAFADDAHTIPADAAFAFVICD